jgi:LmbE family N-acetylglucosaminyl deacetylase
LDISSVRELKKEALDCHRSQHPDSIWTVHDAMHRRRGAESGVQYAEAYALASPRKGRHLLPLSFLSRKK